MISIGLVGVGLIGGSLGQALKSVKTNGKHKYRVAGFSLFQAEVKKAKQLKAIDDGFSDLSLLIQQSDIVVLCTPVQVMPSIVARYVNDFKPGALVTDVGSVKHAVSEELRHLLKPRPDVLFIGGHPLAGSEKSGVQNSRRDLFKKALCVLTPEEHKKKLALIKPLVQMWTDVGARVAYLNPQKHDEILALTSHWPHVMSFALFSMAMKSKAGLNAVKLFSAGSFQDMSRIAASNPDMWKGIFMLNRPALLKIKTQFIREIDALLSLSPQQLQKHLDRISSVKKQWNA